MDDLNAGPYWGNSNIPTAGLNPGDLREGSLIRYNTGDKTYLFRAVKVTPRGDGSWDLELVEASDPDGEVR